MATRQHIGLGSFKMAGMNSPEWRLSKDLVSATKYDSHLGVFGAHEGELRKVAELSIYATRPEGVEVWLSQLHHPRFWDDGTPIVEHLGAGIALGELVLARTVWETYSPAKFNLDLNPVAAADYVQWPWGWSMPSWSPAMKNVVVYAPPRDLRPLPNGYWSSDAGRLGKVPYGFMMGPIPEDSDFWEYGWLPMEKMFDSREHGLIL